MSFLIITNTVLTHRQQKQPYVAPLDTLIITTCGFFFFFFFWFLQLFECSMMSSRCLAARCSKYMSINVRKSTIGHVRPAKIRRVWAESSLLNSLLFKVSHANNEGWSDCVDAQAVWVFAVRTYYPASILRKSTSGRHRPVSYPDGPMTVRYRFT